MKLSEVIAELENGSTKTYEAHYGSGARVTVSRDGEYPDFQKFNHEGTPFEPQSVWEYFSGACDLKLDWYPVEVWIESNESLVFHIDTDREIYFSVKDINQKETMVSISELYRALKNIETLLGRETKGDKNE